MRYLSIDIEATGLQENDLLIELALVPFDSKTGTIETQLSFHTYVKCPSYEELKDSLHPWVRDHNEKIITQAHKEGVTKADLATKVKNYLERSDVQEFFSKEKIIIFGKSLTALDLPFLNRDLGWEFMRHYFSHKVLDLSSFAFGLIDLGLLPEGHHSSSELMRYFKMGDVAHTATDDAVNCATIYIKLLARFS